MARILATVSLFAVVSFATGCTMCAHPYDYCRPTFTGCDGQPCAPNYREGSIFNGCRGECSDCVECVTEVKTPNGPQKEMFVSSRAPSMGGPVMETQHGSSDTQRGPQYTASNPYRQSTGRRGYLY